MVKKAHELNANAQYYALFFPPSPPDTLLNA